jgi:sugar lactone lactonase YvrE
MRVWLAIAFAAVVAAPPQAAQLTAPFQLAVEARGTLLVADGDSGRVVRVDPRTGQRSVFARGLGHVYGVAVGRAGVYVMTATKVLLYHGAKKTVVARGLSFPRGLAVGPDGTVYVSESEDNRVDAFSPAGKRTVIASASLDQPLGLALTPDGSLLVCDSHHGRIVRVGDGGSLTTVLDGLVLPVGLSVSATGDVYVADHVEHGQPGTVVRLRANGTKTILSAGTIVSLSGVAVGRGGVVYVSSFFAPYVGRLDAAGRLKPFPAR